MKLSQNIQRILRVLPLLLFIGALFIVHHEIKAYKLSDISNAFHSISSAAIAISLLIALVNYLAFSGYDFLALRYTGQKLPWRNVLLTSFVSYAISNNTGHGWATGGSVRFRFYNACKIPGVDIIKITLFNSHACFLGIFTLGAVGILLLPADFNHILRGSETITGLGWVFGIALVMNWTAVFLFGKPVTIKGVSLNLPSPLMALGQTLISSLDIILASLTLWALVAGHTGLSFQVFLTIFIIAQVVGAFSQVPGGIGVFETTFLWLLSPSITGAHPVILSALIIYRIIYYIVPLAIAGLALLIYEVRLRKEETTKLGNYISEALSIFVPQVFSILLIITGAVLLISGATPSIPESMRWLRSFVPLPVVEISHLLGSVIGMLLLFLARGIRLRIDAAWYGSILLLALGIAASFLKGMDWQEATVLAFMALLLLPTKKYFRRRSSLLRMKFTPGWITLTASVLIGVTWIGFLSFRHLEYADDLWWQFSYKGDAPRFMRAMVIVCTGVAGYAVWRLFNVDRPKPQQAMPDSSEILIAGAIAKKGKRSQGLLALLGDKQFYWSETKESFIMYASGKNYWVAMGDPVGNEQEFETLLWRFRESADKSGAVSVFHQVSEEYLNLYIDLGMVFLKLGEEAYIDLTSFTLEGKKREDLRTHRRKLSKQAYSFQLLELSEVAANMERLKAVSDAWLAKKNAREKRFALGGFHEPYIAATRVAVIRDPSGKIMSFANLWELESKEELSIDLMRYDPESPRGIMDFLFAEIMLWGHEQDYRWFNLGMAPLAGLENHPMAPTWHKIGTAIFDLSEEFYDFEGLYHYKAKYDPVWRPRYLAVPPRLNMAAVLLRTSTLISGGWYGMFMK